MTPIHILLLSALTLAATAHAQATEGPRVITPGTRGHYVIATDTRGNNISRAQLIEVHNAGNQTRLDLHCQPGNTTSAHLTARYELTGLNGEGPNVTLRLGTRTPLTLNTEDVLRGSNDQTLRFTPPVSALIARALAGGERLVADIARSGRSTLTYTFPATGFNVTWNAMNACRKGAAPPLRGRLQQDAAPTFTRATWRTCRTLTGSAAPTPRAATPQTCDLLIDTVPNGAQIAALNVTLTEQRGTTPLPARAPLTWRAGGPNTPGLTVTQDGGRITVQLPLRPAANTNLLTARVTVQFRNASSLTVNAALPVRAP